MNKKLVSVIERAVRSDQTSFPLNASWRYLHDEYNIGRPLGGRIGVSKEDKDELVALVKKLTGMDLRKNSMADLTGASRNEALGKGRNEKWAGQAVTSGRVALKALPGEPLGLNGQALHLPRRSHLDVAREAIRSLEHDSLLVVENYECFDRLDSLRLSLADRHVRPAVLYRGDPNTSRADSVNDFLNACRLPVLAMVDLDPAGLVIARALPFAAAIVAPDWSVLDGLLKEGNPELYHRQRPVAENVVLNSQSLVVRRLWEAMERHQRGVVQERWLMGDVELLIHPF